MLSHWLEIHRTEVIAIKSNVKGQLTNGDKIKLKGQMTDGEKSN